MAGARACFTIVAVHSTARGPSLGGCRMWTYGDSRDAVADALRLSRAMTFKAAVADLPQGGGKGVIMRRAGDPPLGPEQRRAALLDFAETVDMLDGRYRTAEDVGTSDADMTVIAEGTRHVTGLAVERGGSGDPSPWTALGVQEAIHVACERVWGSTDLGERSIAVVGLGRVGGALARNARARPGRGSWSPTSTRASARSPTSSAPTGPTPTPRCSPRSTCSPRARWAACSTTRPSPPCAAARSPARPTTSSPPRRSPSGSTDRGILWAPDFVANAGGIINIAVELEPEGYAPERAEERVRAVGGTLRTIFDDAEAAGTTPLAAAMTLAYRRLAEASDPRTPASLDVPPA